MDVIFKLRHTLSKSDIKNYCFDINLQVWSAVFRVEMFEVFIGGYHESLLSDRAGKPVCACICDKTNREPIKTRMLM